MKNKEKKKKAKIVKEISKEIDKETIETNSNNKTDKNLKLDLLNSHDIWTQNNEQIQEKSQFFDCFIYILHRIDEFDEFLDDLFL